MENVYLGLRCALFSVLLVFVCCCVFGGGFVLDHRTPFCWNLMVGDCVQFLVAMVHVRGGGLVPTSGLV